MEDTPLTFQISTRRRDAAQFEAIINDFNSKYPYGQIEIDPTHFDASQYKSDERNYRFSGLIDYRHEAWTGATIRYTLPIGVKLECFFERRHSPDLYVSGNCLIGAAFLGTTSMYKTMPYFYFEQRPNPANANGPPFGIAMVARLWKN